MKEQIENNFKYHSPKEGQPEKYNAIREKAKELAFLIDEECPNSREKSLAFTNLEQSVMWANASIARNSEPNQGGSAKTSAPSAITINAAQPDFEENLSKIAEQISKQLSNESLGMSMSNSLRR